MCDEKDENKKYMSEVKGESEVSDGSESKFVDADFTYHPLGIHKIQAEHLGILN